MLYINNNDHSFQLKQAPSGYKRRLLRENLLSLQPTHLYAFHTFCHKKKRRKKMIRDNFPHFSLNGMIIFRRPQSVVDCIALRGSLSERVLNQYVLMGSGTVVRQGAQHLWSEMG